MTHTQLVKELSRVTYQDEDLCRDLLISLENVIAYHLGKNDEVHIGRGFWLRPKLVPCRPKRMPDGSIIQVPEHINVILRLSDGFKGKIKESQLEGNYDYFSREDTDSDAIYDPSDVFRV